MSVTEQENPLLRAKHALLDGYNGLRRRPWLLPFLLSGVFFVVGYMLDPARPLIDHGVFSGMFLIWGATGIVAGVLIYAIITGLHLWSRYTE